MEPYRNMAGQSEIRLRRRQEENGLLHRRLQIESPRRCTAQNRCTNPPHSFSLEAVDPPSVAKGRFLEIPYHLDSLNTETSPKMHYRNPNLQG